jgi:hypothetical protein
MVAEWFLAGIQCDFLSRFPFAFFVTFCGQVLTDLSLADFESRQKITKRLAARIHKGLKKRGSRLVDVRGGRHEYRPRRGHPWYLRRCASWARPGRGCLPPGATASHLALYRRAKIFRLAIRKFSGIFP